MLLRLYGGAGILLTRHTARCWACHPMPRLLRSAPEQSGTLFMVLGNPIPNCDAPRVRKNTCVNIQGFACNTSGLQPGLNRHGLRSFPKDSAVFPGCACARRAVIAPHGRFLRWDGLKVLALRFGMIFAGYPAMDSAGRGKALYKPRSRSSGCCTERRGSHQAHLLDG